MRWILVMFLMLYGFAASAQEMPPDTAFDRRVVLPQGQEVPVEGTTMQCFSAPEYLAIIRMDVGYGNLYDWRLQAMGQMDAYELSVASRDRTILQLKDVLQTLKDDRAWLTLRLKQSSENYAALTSGRRWEKLSMWAVIILETGLLVYQGVK